MANSSRPPPNQAKSSLSTSQTLGRLTVLLGIGFLTFAIYHYTAFENAPEGKRLGILWQQDLDRLTAAKRLPKGFERIKEIQINAATKTAKRWLRDLTVPLSVHKDGTYKMELLILSWEDGPVLGAIIQYNLVDLKTNNMVWELGRTFVLSGDPDLDKLNAQEPARAPVPKK